MRSRHFSRFSIIRSSSDIRCNRWIFFMPYFSGKNISDKCTQRVSPYPREFWIRYLPRNMQFCSPDQLYRVNLGSVIGALGTDPDSSFTYCRQQTRGEIMPSTFNQIVDVCKASRTVFTARECSDDDPHVNDFLF